MNIYKLITYAILLNVLLASAFVMGNWTNYEDIASSDISGDTFSDIGDKAYDLRDDDSTASTAQDTLTFGSGIKWTRMIRDLFKIGLGFPISISSNQISDDDVVAMNFLVIIDLFRYLVMLFVIIKIINFIKNRDTK